MKKIIAVFLGVIAVAIGVFGINKTQNVHAEYLRIHIRANSNDQVDQAVKYRVKERVVEYLTPYLTDVKSKDQALSKLNDLICSIEEVANGVLTEEGFNYKCRAEIKNENFPTRTYEDLTLNQGYYDALILYLGSGSGDNWWCVVYPPLCFVGDEVNYVYKSKLLEIIDSFFNK